MGKRKDFIVGIVLIAASIAVIARYFYLRENLEQMTGSVFFLRFAFIIFSLILAGAGIKKIISSRSSDNSPKDHNNEDI